jgi:hypothetical protein
VVSATYILPKASNTYGPEAREGFRLLYISNTFSFKNNNIIS